MSVGLGRGGATEPFGRARRGYSGGRGEEGGCWKKWFKEKDVRTPGQNSGDAGEKELIRSKVRKLQSRAVGGNRGERSEVKLIHSPTAGWLAE